MEYARLDGQSEYAVRSDDAWVSASWVSGWRSTTSASWDRCWRHGAAVCAWSTVVDWQWCSLRCEYGSRGYGRWNGRWYGLLAGHASSRSWHDQRSRWPSSTWSTTGRHYPNPRRGAPRCNSGRSHRAYHHPPTQRTYLPLA